MTKVSSESIVFLDGAELVTLLEFNISKIGREKTKQTPISRDGKARTTVYGVIEYSGNMVFEVPETGLEVDLYTIVADKSIHTLTVENSSTHRYQLRQVEFHSLSSAVPEAKAAEKVTVEWVAADGGWI